MNSGHIWNANRSNKVLGALCVANDGMRNEGAWVALSQSLGFMFS